ncbi:MAG TPA: membrane protein insertase YidC [Acidobacteriaceae bacterium]|nr:membrane protein insertase YidC [Acidobacteriaceae bacterium]
MAEISNPNQQGGQDNRSLLAIMMVFMAILLGVQYYHAKTSPPPPSKPASPPATATPAAPAPNEATPAPQASSVTSGPAVQATSETTTTVENKLYRVQFSNRGGQVTSWILKGPQFTDSNGKPLDLVNAQAAKLFGYPLSFYTYDGTSLSISSIARSNHIVTATLSTNIPAGLSGRAVSINGVGDSSFNGTYIVTQTGADTFSYSQDYGDNASSAGGIMSTVNGATGEMLARALFVPSATGSLSPPATLTFKYSSGDLQATKTFSFDPNTYLLHAAVEVTRGGSPIRALLSWPSGFGDQNEDYRGSSYSSSQFDSYRNGSDDHLAPKKISGGDTLNGPFDWAGVSDPFFTAVFLPDSPATSTVATLHGELDVSKVIKRVGFGSGSAPTKPLSLPVLGAAVGDVSGTSRMQIFVGPKSINVLKSVHAANPKVTLEPMLEFGFWGFIGKYLFLALQFIHKFVANVPGSWGWAIVLLTVLINILVLPARIKSMHSALKMQRIQPQMDAIKEKYKKYKVTDPKRNEMNAEIMQLQKDHGVNMFGGCIPTLVTLPLLYAFFTMLPRVVELRHAPWLWVPDLQAADPWHILPILTIVFQFLSQYYTPSPGVDPQQQKMMAFMMPAFFGYMTWNYGSGIALYWLVGLLIGVAQQMIMNRTSLGREMREIALKRARRKATTIQGRR